MTRECSHSLNLLSHPQVPLKRGTTLCEVDVEFLFLMLVTKLKGLLGAAAIAGMSILAPSPSHATSSCAGASFYGVGDGYHGQITANGERFNTYAMTAAHRYLPFGTRLRVTHGGRSVVVRINDRGPFVAGRDLDLSYAAFQALASPSRGHINVCYSRA